MYIVEAQTTPVTQSFDASYWLVGEHESVSKVKQHLASLVITSLHPDLKPIMDFNTADELLGNIDEGKIESKDLDAFMSIIKNAFWLPRFRREVLLNSAANGELDTASCMEEFSALKRNEDIMKGDDDARWLTRDGYRQYVDDEGELKVEMEDDLDSGFGSEGPEAELFRQTGVTHYVYQHELAHGDSKYQPPKVHSDKQHYTLGTLDENGNFQASFTLLHDYYSSQKQAE